MSRYGLDRPFLIGDHLTGMENATLEIELVTDIKGYMDNIGCCERCRAVKSERWYM